MRMSVGDIRNAVKKLMNGRSPGIEGITSEMQRYGGANVIEWFLCLAEVKIPVDWKRAIVYLYR